MIFFYHRTEAALANRIKIRQKSKTTMFNVLYLFYIKLYYKVYLHAIDNFKLIAEIHVLASKKFKTKLC